MQGRHMKKNEGNVHKGKVHAEKTKWAKTDRYGAVRNEMLANGL